jgi:hypothetical protein
MTEQDLSAGAIEALAQELQIKVHIEAGNLGSNPLADGFAVLGAPVKQKLPI